jgi:GntR family transcriptional regulator, N-acetylglucosamine utilization regulator
VTPRTNLPPPVLSRDSGIPLYVQLREFLRERIQRGDWAPEDPLPTEESLVEQFGVSRATVRQALTDLVREGLIVRRAGLGTFPRQPHMVLRMERFLSFSDDLRERGIAHESRLIEVEETGREALPDAVAFELPKAGVIRIRTLRLADDQPVLVFEHNFPADRCAFLLDERLDDPQLSFYDLVVRRHGISYARAVGEISAVIAADAEARLLELPDGAPVTELRTRTYDERDRLVEYSRAVLRADRYRLVFGTDWRTAAG